MKAPRTAKEALAEFERRNAHDMPVPPWAARLLFRWGRESMREEAAKTVEHDGVGDARYCEENARRIRSIPTEPEEGAS